MKQVNSQVRPAVCINPLKEGRFCFCTIAITSGRDQDTSLRVIPLLNFCRSGKSSRVRDSHGFCSEEYYLLLSTLNVEAARSFKTLQASTMVHKAIAKKTVLSQSVVVDLYEMSPVVF
jgi:hypothetical protein